MQFSQVSVYLLIITQFLSPVQHWINARTVFSLFRASLWPRAVVHHLTAAASSTFPVINEHRRFFPCPSPLIFLQKSWRSLSSPRDVCILCLCVSVRVEEVYYRSCFFASEQEYYFSTHSKLNNYITSFSGCCSSGGSSLGPRGESDESSSYKKIRRWSEAARELIGLLMVGWLVTFMNELYKTTTAEVKQKGLRGVWTKKTNDEQQLNKHDAAKTWTRQPGLESDRARERSPRREAGPEFMKKRNWRLNSLKLCTENWNLTDFREY